MLNSLLVSVLRITGIWKYARYRREVADIAVDDAEQRSDGRLVRLDAIEVADPRHPGAPCPLRGVKRSAPGDRQGVDGANPSR
jgi:hypothetical protein